MILFYAVIGAVVVTIYSLFLGTIGDFMPWIVKDIVAEVINAAAFALLMIFDKSLLTQLSKKY